MSNPFQLQQSAVFKLGSCWRVWLSAPCPSAGVYLLRHSNKCCRFNKSGTVQCFIKLKKQNVAFLHHLFPFLIYSSHPIWVAFLNFIPGFRRGRAFLLNSTKEEMKQDAAEVQTFIISQIKSGITALCCFGDTCGTPLST